MIAAGIGAWACAARGNLSDAAAEEGLAPDSAPICDQVGDFKNWVVSTTPIAYDRYCTVSCKPDVPEALTPSVNCIALDTEIVHKYAQTSDGNGRAFVWKSIPLADSLTLSDIPAEEGELKYVPQPDHTGGRLRAIFGKSARRRRTASKVLEDPPVPGCHCRCGQYNPLNETFANGTLPTPEEQLAATVGDYNEKWSFLECPGCPTC